MSLESNWKDGKDPLSIDVREVSNLVVKGAIFLGIGIPLLAGLGSLVGGGE